MIMVPAVFDLVMAVRRGVGRLNMPKVHPVGLSPHSRSCPSYCGEFRLNGDLKVNLQVVLLARLRPFESKIQLSIAPISATVFLKIADASQTFHTQVGNIPYL